MKTAAAKALTAKQDNKHLKKIIEWGHQDKDTVRTQTVGVMKASDER